MFWWRPRACSEHVLAAADLGKGGDGVSGGAHGGLELRLIGAQEWVGGALFAHRSRHRRTACRAQRVDAVCAVDEGGVAGLDGEGEAGVRLGVFVAAIDPGLRRQGPELRQRVPHLLRRALEEPPAAESKERVAAEHRARGREPEGDVAAGVAGHVEDAGDLGAERVLVAVAHLDVDAGNARAIGARPHDRAFPLGLEREIAAGVIGVVMGVEDMRQAPAGLGERALHRFGLRGIDGGGGVRIGVVQQVDVVVPERVQLTDDKLGHGSSGCGLRGVDPSTRLA